mgnify:CR=1 FL=1
MPSIASEIIKAIKANLWMLLLYSAMVTTFSAMLPTRTGNSGGSYAVVTILIYYLHRQVLFDLRLRPSGKPVVAHAAKIPKDSLLRFMLVSGLFIAVALVPAWFVAFKWATVHGGLDKQHLMGMLLLLGIPMLWILLSAFGTLLPAAASRQPFSVPRAWKAGQKTGLVVAFQLLVFVGLSYAAVFALAVLLNKAFGSTLDAPPLSYAVEIFFGALFLLPSLMTVVILVRAFKRAYPMSSV